MTPTVLINRLRTGVPGLDAVLGGGLPEFSFNLIAGPPGSGKTTLAHQLMFALATPERPALYFTVLGEPPLKMLRYQQQFGFFDAEAVGKSIRFIGLSDDAASGDLDLVLNRIIAEVQAAGPGLVFVDSFRSVVQASSLEGTASARLQQFVQQLGMHMTSWQATTFLIGEYFSELDANPVFTVADGLIWLRQCVERNSMTRKLEIMKMRGQATSPGLHSFRIGSDGLIVFAPVVPHPHGVHSTDRDRLSERLSLGVPGLDAMLGGGLPRGYSLLVAGPSGSGKTIAAAAFLAAGAAAGEKGVIASFEQHPTTSRNRVLADLLDAGQVVMIDSREPDLSLDELLSSVIAEIHRSGATRVVIDSLSGLELGMAPTFREDFRESLARLVMALSEASVTVLMTSELEDRYTDLRFSPYGTAFMTDAIIVHRYIEVESRLRRVLAVVKVRGSAHSDELCEYTINETGLVIGERLREQEGLLGGRPTHTRSVRGDSVVVQ
jgi:circadian clock protein KaiC